MRFKRSWLQSESHLLDMAPLIDVVFQLLIFFMLTSSFIFQPGIKIHLPKAITSEVLHEQNLVITITGDNQIFLDNKLINRANLEERLKVAAKNDLPLLIKADRKASLGKVVEIWDLCRALGISKVNIATSQEPQQ